MKWEVTDRVFHGQFPWRMSESLNTGGKVTVNTFLYFCPGTAMLKCRVLKSESMTHADACTVFMTAGWHQKLFYVRRYCNG